MNKYTVQVLYASMEDYPPLWEILWEINTLRNSQDEKSQNISVSTIKQLLELGYIELYQSVGFLGDLTTVEDNKKEKILDEPSSWNVKEEKDLMYRIGITKKGEKVLGVNSNKEH